MFNWSIKQAEGEFILLMSPFVKQVNCGYIEELVSNAQRRKVGVVGGEILYSNHTIKSAGIVIEKDGAIRYAFEGFPKGCRGYMNRNIIQQNLSAVADENMLINKEIWQKINGFDILKSRLESTVDFCLRVREKGFEIVYTPYSKEIVLYNRTNEQRINLKNRKDDFAYNPNLICNYSLKK